MPFEQTVHPQYRDAEADGLIGLKGAMHYFQDTHTWFMHSLHKGNDEYRRNMVPRGFIPATLSSSLRRSIIQIRSRFRHGWSPTGSPSSSM